jgi:hypothetical protein
MIEAIQKYIGFSHESHYWDQESTPLVIKIFGRTVDESFRIVENAYDLYRSILNLLLDRTIRIQFSRQTLLASVVPAVGYGVFLPDGEFVCPYINLDVLNHQFLCKGDIDQEKVDLLINKSDSMNNADMRLIQAIKLHNSGLETTNWDYAYLSFWRVFEVLVFGERINYNMDDVVARICTLLGIKSGVDKEFLRLGANHRNRLVHRGIPLEDEQAMVQLLKSFSTQSIFRFLEISDLYPTGKMIDEFFTLAGSPLTDLNDRKRVIENILLAREQI